MTSRGTEGEENVCCRSDIEKYKSCQIWLAGYNSASTKKSYKLDLLLFCRHYNTDPDSLLLLDPKQVMTMVLNYVMHLKKKIARYYPEQVTNDLRGYKREEISKVLSVADVRDRCIILLMASTGMRIGAIKSLKLKNLTRLPHESNIGLVTVYAESKKDRYIALMTPECLAAIDEYIEYRKNQYEKITDDSYIIRDKCAPLSNKINRPKALTEHTINKQIKFLLRKAGVLYDQLQPAHSLRKYYDTCLMNSDVADSFKHLLMGHKAKLDVYYDRNSEISQQKMILEFTKAVDALTINEEYRLKKITEYETKLNDVPKISELQSDVAARMIEQHELKKQIESLQLQYRNDSRAMQQKYEQDMDSMRKLVVESRKEVLQMHKDNLKRQDRLWRSQRQKRRTITIS